MVRTIFSLLLAGAGAAAYAASPAKLPPAHPVPLAADPQEAAVMATVDQVLKALTSGDRTTVLNASRADGGLTAVVEQPDGTRMVRHHSWAEFVAGLAPGQAEERLTDPAIEVDGGIAMVWSHYTVVVGGKVDHCGTDHFDLVRESSGWKILNVTWSQRTIGCE